MWVRPVVAGSEPVQVNIGLYDEDGGHIAYRMYGDPESADAEPVVYNQGKAELIQLKREKHWIFLRSRNNVIKAKWMLPRFMKG